MTEEIKHNYRAEKIRSNLPSKQLLLAKVHALNSLQEAIREMKVVGFSIGEIQNLIPELYRQVVVVLISSPLSRSMKEK